MLREEWKQAPACRESRVSHDKFVDQLVFVHSYPQDNGLAGTMQSLNYPLIATQLGGGRDRKQVIGLDQVNSVLIQPHWRNNHDMDQIGYTRGPQG